VLTSPHSFSFYSWTGTPGIARSSRFQRRQRRTVCVATSHRPSVFRAFSLTHLSAFTLSLHTSFRLLVQSPNHLIGSIHRSVQMESRQDRAAFNVPSSGFLFIVLDYPATLLILKSPFARGYKASGSRQPTGYLFSLFHGPPSSFAILRCAVRWIFIIILISCCRVRDCVFVYKMDGTFGQICPYVHCDERGTDVVSCRNG